MKHTTAIACCVLMLLACAACKSTSSKAAAGEGSAFHTLLRGYQTGLANAPLRIARTQQEWDAIWSEHASRVLPRPAAPPVDWTQDMVVCVAPGPRSSAGYGVEIDSLQRRDDRMIVAAHETKPAPDAIVPQVLTQPYHMIVTRKFDGPVELALH